MNPCDLVKDAIDRGVVLRTRKYGGITLDGYDLFPAPGKCKSYGVAAGTGKEVD